MRPGRDGRTPVGISGFTKAPSLFTTGSAVARRINGLIKHAILPVMQSLSMSRRREKERGFIRPAPPLCPHIHAPPVDHAAGLVSLPLLCARLHSILARNRRYAHVEAALWEINVPYAKRAFTSRFLSRDLQRICIIVDSRDNASSYNVYELENEKGCVFHF